MASITELLGEYPYSRAILIGLAVVGLVFVRSCQLESSEERMLNEWESALDERIAGVERSLDSLQILDPALLSCVRRAAMDRAAIHPQNTGGIDDVRELKLLYCRNSNIDSLDGIGELANLTFLDLGRNRIRTMAPLRGHANLKSLHLNQNPVEDVVLVRTLPALKEVYLPDLPEERCAQVEQWVEGLKSNIKSIRCEKPEASAIASSQSSQGKRKEDQRSRGLTDAQHEELLRYEQGNRYRGR